MMQLTLRKDANGVHVISGGMRLKAALSLSDEVKVTAPGLGEMFIVKLPDGRLVATQDQQTMALFGVCEMSLTEKPARGAAGPAL